MNALRSQKNLSQRKQILQKFLTEISSYFIVSKIWGWHTSRQIILEENDFSLTLPPGKYYSQI